MRKKESCQSTIWCDRALVDLQESVSGSDLIILCTPVDIILEQLKRFQNGYNLVAYLLISVV